MSGAKEEVTCDFVVVGAGIMGCWAALYLAEEGHNVVIVEQVSVRTVGVLLKEKQFLLSLAKFSNDATELHVTHNFEG